VKACDATRFENGKSEAHIALLEEAAAEHGCSCKPYVDWFTYNRWKAQGMQVQKGEHGVKLTTYPKEEVVDKETGKIKTISRPKTTTVFCRCQVANQNGRAR
jgi:antirestriction protein ArdC